MLTAMTSARLHRFTRRERGVVLPIVLVLLVILTSLVLAQIRRGTIDQQLSTNSRAYTLTETSAQSALRWCEAKVMRGPVTTGGTKHWVNWVKPDGVTAEWTKVGNWVQANGATGYAEFMSANTNGTVPGADFPGVDTAQCIIEDASAELEGDGGARSRVQTDESLEPPSVLAGTAGSGLAKPEFTCPLSKTPHFCKVRVTVRVRPLYSPFGSCDDNRRGCLYVQSELRFSI
ncbi:hypothetical protein BH10PSE17_BH10PSE17_13750 [soil metagenome]